MLKKELCHHKFHLDLMIDSEYQACPILTIEEEKSEINQSYCNIISIMLIRSILSSVQIKDNKSVTRQWKNKETEYS